ncbi:hypothetical protein Gpo141_00003064 [Globisporangium polare]
MGLEIVRRMSRYTWLRLLVTLAIYMIAVPGTVRSNAFGGVAAAKVPAQSDPMERELKHEQRDITDDQVRVFYCTTCGFQQNFLEFKTYLEERYPHLADRVYGENYEVDPMKKLLARALGYLQIVAMVLMVAGEYIFRALGLDTALLQKALDNRIGCFAVILLTGWISQGLVSTGAFEVTFNDELLFSKLEVGRWPTLEELATLLDARGLNELSM